MYNLLICADIQAWDSSNFQFDRKRFLEHTEPHILEQFNSLSTDALKRLMELPTVFAIEGEERDSRIGYIKGLKVRSDYILIDFTFDPIFPSLQRGMFAKMEKALNISRFETHRTHWAIKDDDLFEELYKAGYLTKEQMAASKSFRKKDISTKTVSDLNTIDALNNNQVFIVHGHDDPAKQEVAEFIKYLGLVPIILHEQANRGKTIIEKIETYTDVGFAVVLYTPCDLGNSKDAALTKQILNPRARQNVVLEHGYLMAKLGRSRVAALVKGKLETPNDISGVVYIDFDEEKDWKNQLMKEIRVAGIEFLITI